MIQELDDTTAREILSVIARARAESVSGAPALNPALRQALAAFAQNMQLGAHSTSASEGEMSRQALLVAGPCRRPRDGRRDFHHGRRLADPAPKFDLGATLAITTAVLVVLQTHIKFERARDGAWSLKLEKKPASETLLKTLVQKFTQLHKVNSAATMCAASASSIPRTRLSCPIIATHVCDESLQCFRVT